MTCYKSNVSLKDEAKGKHYSQAHINQYKAGMQNKENVQIMNVCSYILVFFLLKLLEFIPRSQCHERSSLHLRVTCCHPNNSRKQGFQVPFSPSHPLLLQEESTTLQLTPCLLRGCCMFGSPCSSGSACLCMMSGSGFPFFSVFS